MAETEQEKAAREAKEKQAAAAKAAQGKSREQREKEISDKKAKMTADQAKVYERVHAKLEQAPLHAKRLLALVQDGMMTEAELANIEASLPKLADKDKDAANLRAEDENAKPRPAEIGLPRPEMRAMQERVIAQLEGLGKQFKEYGDKSRSVELKDEDQAKAEEMADKLALMATHRQRGG